MGVRARSHKFRDVINPATGEFLPGFLQDQKKILLMQQRMPQRHGWSWRNTPATQRIQYLFRMKQILEDNC